MTKYLGFIALATAALAACEQNRGVTSPASAVATSLQAQRSDRSSDGGDGPRAVYTLTNQVAGNAVAVFNRSADGTLTAAGTIATGGTGTGAGLGSQGAVALSDDGRRLFAVNAGSNDVSVFDVGPAGLSLASRTASGGPLPISLTVHGNVLYVLNAGGNGNISGFTISTTGGLTAIPGSTQLPPRNHVGPAPGAVSPPGRTLLGRRDQRRALRVHRQRERIGLGLLHRGRRLHQPQRCERGERPDRCRRERYRAEQQQPLPVRPADWRRPGDPRVPHRAGRSPRPSGAGRRPSRRHEGTRSVLGLIFDNRRGAVRRAPTLTLTEEGRRT